MNGGINRLNDLKVKAFLKASRAGTAATKKLSDGHGMYLAITAAGSPVWRIKYRHGGTEKVYAVGIYPEITLEAARAAREVVRAHLREGRDPMQARQLERATAEAGADATFASVAAEWLEKKRARWSDVHFLKSHQALERDVLPILGKLPIAGITTAMVSRCIEKVVARGANETASKILWNVRGIFELAQTKDGSTIRENPATAAAAVLQQHKPHEPHPALLTFPELGDVLRRAEGAALSPAVRMAHRLIAFTAARIGNAVEAQWPEFDLDSDTPAWTIPRAQMKMRDGRAHDHRVLLGPTIAGELTRWKQITGGRGYVFPSPHGERAHISKESIEKSYRVTLGLEGKHTVHGWRASFSTLANDNGFDGDAIELTLDHVNSNKVARAYDRGERLSARVKLMYWWDAQLGAAQHGGTVLPFRATARN
jgi:integrase